jgi:FKBP-type peptidyl-prolyl cis-trans isomerase SlyD
MKIGKNILVNLEYRLSDSLGNHLNPDEGELIYLHGGYGQVFDDFEVVMEGKSVGDTFCVTFTPEQAFGVYNEELCVEEELENLPEDIFVGMELDGIDEITDDTLIYVVKEIGSTNAILDANHELAGKTLVFEGRVIELQELSEQEVQKLLEFDDSH